MPKSISNKDAYIEKLMPGGGGKLKFLPQCFLIKMELFPTNEENCNTHSSSQ